MFRLSIAEKELWDADREMFVTIKPCEVVLEHSLISISRWEEKWHQAFLGKKPKTDEMVLDYVSCMVVGHVAEPLFYLALTANQMKEIEAYINDPHSATVIYGSGQGSGRSGDVVTSELIYYWMITFGIEWEAQKWHLNRLLNLIRVCELKSRKASKGSGKARGAQYHALNQQRRRLSGSRG